MFAYLIKFLNKKKVPEKYIKKCIKRYFSEYNKILINCISQRIRQLLWQVKYNLLANFYFN